MFSLGIFESHVFVFVLFEFVSCLFCLGFRLDFRFPRLLLDSLHQALHIQSLAFWLRLVA